MKFNYFSITFWFKIYNNPENLIVPLRDSFKEEFTNYNIRSEIPNNLFIPIINAMNPDLRTNLSISQINLQYNMDRVTKNDFNNFKEKILKLYENLTEAGIEIEHTAICINTDLEEKNALDKLTKNIINKKICTNDLVDVSLKFGKKHEDLFYKIINLLNKKQIKINNVVDDKGRNIPIPLIPWNNSLIEKELIEIQYEINDKYSFDYTKNYHTTEFYLNKMFYILEQDMESDIENLITKGEL